MSLDVCYSTFTQRDHSCSRLLEAEAPPRNIQSSLLNYDIEQYVDKTSDATNFRHAPTAIHNGAINSFTDYLLGNGVLQVKPLLIAGEELELPRESRVTRAQLRFG